jgi:hypothetical protein
MRTWAACGLVIASSRRFRVPRTAESKDESARLKSSRQALWMMIVTELRSWERDQPAKTDAKEGDLPPHTTRRRDRGVRVLSLPQVAPALGTRARTRPDPCEEG